MLTDSTPKFRVGRWRVEPLHGSISEPGGQPKHLQPKVMEVLVCLASRAHEVVTRQELLDCAWDRTIVSDEVLTRTIADLRRALGDAAGHPRYVETIPKVGYRLVATVEALPRENELAVRENAFRIGQLFRAPGLASSIIALAIFLAVFGYSEIKFRTQPGDREAPAVSTTVRTTSLAVLPFNVCASNGDDPLLAERVSRGLRLALATFAGLSVADYESVALLSGAGVDRNSIMEVLDVDFALAGEICGSGDAGSIRSVLYDRNGIEYWSKTLGPAETGSIKIGNPPFRRIASEIGSALREELPAEFDVPAAGPALEQFLLGRQHVQQGNSGAARVAFERALRIYPGYADAAFEIAELELEGLGLDQGSGLDRATQMASRALQLAAREYVRRPESFDANLTMGRILTGLSVWERELAWRRPALQLVFNNGESYQDAEGYLRAAIDIRPDAVEPFEILARLLDVRGEHAEAMLLREYALSLAPYNFDIAWKLALQWAAIGRYEEALALYERFQELPDPPLIAYFYALELMQVHGYWDQQCEALIDLLINRPDIARQWPIRFQLAWFVSDLLYLGLDDHANAWRARITTDDMPEWAALYTERFYRWGIGDQASLTARSIERLATMDAKELLDPWYNLPMNWAWDIGAGGDVSGAIEIMEKIRHAPTLHLEREVLPSLLLARLYAMAGRDEETRLILDEWATRIETSTEAGIVHPELLFRLAEIYALQQEDEKAIDALTRAVEYHWRMPWWERPWLTDLNGLAEDPRTAALRLRVEQDLARQAARIDLLLRDYPPEILFAASEGDKP